MGVQTGKVFNRRISELNRQCHREMQPYGNAFAMQETSIIAKLCLKGVTKGMTEV